MDRFTPEVCEKLKTYVYRLEDDEGRTFYVGKGQNNRVFEHVACAAGNEQGLRYDRIRELKAQGKAPRIVIHRHGLDESVAFEVEAALIDAYASETLTNVVRGHDAERGMATATQIAEMYGAPAAEIPLPAILIKIERQWSEDLTPEQLYERTRRYWNCNPEGRAVPPKIALCVARGLIREVYEIDHWEVYSDMQNEVVDPTRIAQRRGSTQVRRGFIGRVTPHPELRNALIGKSVRHIRFGSGNPITYEGPASMETLTRVASAVDEPHPP